MKAKTIIEGKFWILEDEGKRVGTVALKDNSVCAMISDKPHNFASLEELSEKYNITFSLTDELAEQTVEMEIYDYPTAHQPFNALWNVEKKLPIYTKAIKSTNYHCAGYYIIKFAHGWVKAFCPKLITLQRYTYAGPYKSKFEMMEQLRIHNGSGV